MFIFHLTFTDISVFWPGVVVLGFVIGALSGLLGTGGGFLLTPVLRFIFEVPFNIAVGSGLGSVAVTSAFGSLHHFKLRHVNLKLGALLLSGSLVGVEIGGRLLVYLKNSGSILVMGRSMPAMDLVISSCYIILLCAAAAMMFNEAKKYDRPPEACPPKRDLSTYRIRLSLLPLGCCKRQDLQANLDLISIPWIVAAGLFSGVISGFLGVGGGFIMTPVLIWLFGLPAVVAVGTELFQVAVTSFSGTISHFSKGNVDLLLVALVLCGSLAGAKIGASFTEKLRGKKLRLYFAWFLIFSVAFIIYQIII